MALHRKARVKLPPLSERIPKVLRLLFKQHPDAHCELVYQNAFELLCAVILSAQCTDKRVNLVTPALFIRYPTPVALAQAEQKDVERLIHSTGFYRNKAKHLVGMARMLMAKFHGEVPNQMEDLLLLPGVARKTANVILGTWFKQNEGFVVDTHVLRLTKRLGWTRHRDPIRVERDMMRLVPKKQWTRFAHTLVIHGRRICFARNPACADCPVNQLCPSSRV